MLFRLTYAVGGKCILKRGCAIGEKKALIFIESSSAFFILAGRRRRVNPYSKRVYIAVGAINSYLSSGCSMP